MARSEARISVEVWATDSDFAELTPLAQWMYFLLLSQPDLAHDGVIALRERRWARGASGMTVAAIGELLAELEKHHYVVIDYDEGELLVRSFIRRDKVYRQPNVLRAALDHLPVVRSPLLRAALAKELWRVMALEMSGDSPAILRDMLKELGEDSSKPPAMPTADPSENPSAEGSDMPTAGSPGEKFPYPLSPDPENTSAPAEPMLDGFEGFSPPPPPPEADPLPHSHPGKKWDSTDIDGDPKWIDFWAAYPSSKDKGHARTAWLKALRSGTDPDVITSGAWAYHNDRTRSREFTKHAATWLNGECWADYEHKESGPTATAPRPFWEN